MLGVLFGFCSRDGLGKVDCLKSILLLKMEKCVLQEAGG
jgi:hypothetical protein